MVDVFMPVSEVLRLDCFSGAEIHGVPSDAEVHLLGVDGDHPALLDGSGTVIAAIVPAGGPATASGEARIVLAPAVSPLSVAAALAEELQERTRSLAQRSHAILKALAHAELQGSSLRGIVTLLEQLVGNPVILKDASHRVLAWSGQPAGIDPARQATLAHGGVTDEVLQALVRNGVTERIRSERSAFRIEGDEEVGLGPRVMCPARAGDTLLGYLSISEGMRQLDALDLLAVEYGATVVALHMARERAVEESSRSQHALLLYELLYSPEHSGERRAQQASLLGFDIAQEFNTVAIRFDESEVQTQDPDRWRRQLNAVIAQIEASFERLGVKSHLAMTEDDGVLLVIPSSDAPLEPVIMALLDDIEAHQRVPGMAVGVSPPRAATLGLGQSYDAARIAARLGRTVRGRRSVTRYADLGVLRLLNEMSEDVVADHVATTLTDDVAFQKQFVETFGAYASAGYNKAAAARSLFIHVNTMKYRLGRIHAVTGHDPTEHQGRFALECTLRLLELRQARSQQDERA